MGTRRADGITPDRELVANDLNEVKAGKVQYAGIWFENDKHGVEKIIVRVRKSKKERYFPRRTFYPDKSPTEIQRALDYFNEKMREKRRFQLQTKNKDHAVMKMPIADLIDECIEAMKSREVEPWSDNNSCTIYTKILRLKRFSNRYYKIKSDPTLVNRIIDFKTQANRRRDIRDLLKEYEKQVKEEAFGLIGNLTLEKVREIAKKSQSPNGFALLLKHTCYTQLVLKSTACAVREWLKWVQTKYDPDKTATGWLPVSSEDFKGIKPAKDYSKERDTKQFYTPEERTKLIETWEQHLKKYKKSMNYCHYLAFKAGSSFGPRIGEIFSLTPADLNFQKNKIYINATVTADLNGKATLGDTTKTGEERESLCIDPQIMQELQEHIKRNKIQRHELVFSGRNSKDTLLVPQYFNHAFRKICKKAGIRYLPSHLAIRKTFINNGIESIRQESNQEKAINRIAKAVGHSPEMCRQAYLVPELAEEDIANKAIQNLYTPKKTTEEEQLRTQLKQAVDTGDYIEAGRISEELVALTSDAGVSAVRELPVSVMHG